MPLPSISDFLARLEANPAAAAAFDAATRRERPHCKTRREAVEATLTAVNATLAENAALRAKVQATKTKIAALEAARKSSTLMKNIQVLPPPKKVTSPIAPPAPAVKLTTAAEFQKSIAPPTMARSEFNKLSHPERNRWIREGGKLV